MTCEFLLEEFRNRDIRLSIEADLLVVDAPRGALSDQDREMLRDHRDELFALLAVPGPWAQRAAKVLSAAADLREIFEHRAAVCEYDGRLGRDAAEKMAFDELRVATRNIYDSMGVNDD